MWRQWTMHERRKMARVLRIEPARKERLRQVLEGLNISLTQVATCRGAERKKFPPVRAHPQPPEGSHGGDYHDLLPL